MKPLERRLAKLEGHAHGGWRAYAHLPAGQIPDTALLGCLAESEGWPPGHVPTDEELRAIAARRGFVVEDEDAP